VSLVKAGADVNRPNPDGITPLINALDNRHFDIAMHLLDKGANPHTWDMSGRTPLYVAVDMNSYRPGMGGIGGPRSRASDGEEAAKPAGPGAMDVVNRLISMGVDTNHQLTRKRPYGAGRGRFAEYDLRGGVGPLMLASMRQDHEAMRVLLAHGAEVDVPNVFQMTPLMVAVGMSGTARGNNAVPADGDVQESMIRTIDLLLDAGADVNARILDSRTHTAALQSYIQGRDQEGRTALFGAAEWGRDRVVKHLLERGADPTLRDAAGKTALDAARKPLPPGPGVPAASKETEASRAATIALLEARLGPASSGGP
jgi:cytohesin